MHTDLVDDCRRSSSRLWLPLVVLIVTAFYANGVAWASATAGQKLPDAPEALTTKPALTPCQVMQASVGFGWDAAQGAAERMGNPAAAAAYAIGEPVQVMGAHTGMDLMPCSSVGSFLSNLPLIKKLPHIDWYARFISGPQVKPMTPREKAWLAVRDVAEPFNGLTILASSAIAVASDSHSGYGPGFPGFGKYVGVSYSQDMTGEFFGTFLIPSIVHQDPHYHRMPSASLKRRIAHVFYQVAWTQGDSGNSMLNYADLFGFAIDDEIGNLYVPDRRTNAGATAERYTTALATAPIDNAVTEFLPDLARRLHVRIVLIQQIINQVANKGSTTGQ